MEGKILFSRYKIISKIGNGSFSTVYQAIDLNRIQDKPNPNNPSNFVAVKEINLENHKGNQLHSNGILDFKSKSPIQKDLQNSQAVSNFIQTTYELNRQQLLREIQISKSVHHPNIVECYEVLTENGQPDINSNSSVFYLIMEFMPNGSLLEYLQQYGKCLDEEKACHFFKQMVSAVSYLYSQNIIHRDIKFENFVVVNNDIIKLIDFGLSIQLENQDDNETSKIDYFNRTFCGSISYSAPEIIAQNKYSYSGDIWSLGVVLFGMIFGRFPFQGHGEVLINEILTQQLFLPKQVSKELENLILEMLRKNPKNRLTIEQVQNHRWLQMDHHITQDHPISKTGSISSVNSSAQIVKESAQEKEQFSPTFSRQRISRYNSQKQIPEFIKQSQTEISPLTVVDNSTIPAHEDFFSNFGIGLNAFAENQRGRSTRNALNPFLNNEFLSMKEKSGKKLNGKGQNTNDLPPLPSKTTHHDTEALPYLKDIAPINANTTSNLKGTAKLVVPRQRLVAHPKHKSVQLERVEPFEMKRNLRRNPFI